MSEYLRASTYDGAMQTMGEPRGRALFCAGRRLSILVAVLGSLALAACEPLPPKPVFTVDTYLDGSDIDPGDGVCESTTEGGACTLRAAIEEANALGRADVKLPEDMYRVGDEASDLGALTVTGEVHIKSTGADPAHIFGELAEPVEIEVVGTLVVDRTEFLDVFIRVDGTLLMVRSAARHQWPHAHQTLHVTSTGTAVLAHSELGGGGTTAAVQSDGNLHLAYVSVVSSGSPAVHTGPDGSTSTMASELWRTKWSDDFTVDPDAEVCSGTPPTSLGYNYLFNSTCALGHPTDIEEVTVTEHPSGSWTADPTPYDKIPFGEADCGTDHKSDINGSPRPAAAVPGAEALCDIGAHELQPEAPSERWSPTTGATGPN